ncbi:hypothetical protein ACU4GD_29975 [Cupriavidus basilensis]
MRNKATAWPQAGLCAASVSRWRAVHAFATMFGVALLMEHAHGLLTVVKHPRRRLPDLDWPPDRRKRVPDTSAAPIAADGMPS